MDTDETALQYAFSFIIGEFGKNHARIYWLLVNRPNQSVQQIQKALNLDHPTVYRTLHALNQKSLISHTNTKPRYFSAHGAIEKFEELATQRKNELKDQLQQAKNNLKKLIRNASSQSGEKYLIQINGGQTRLFDAKTNVPIQEIGPILEIKKGIDEHIQKEKEKQWQTTNQPSFNKH